MVCLTQLPILPFFYAASPIRAESFTNTTAILSGSYSGGIYANGSDLITSEHLIEVTSGRNYYIDSDVAHHVGICLVKSSSLTNTSDITIKSTASSATGILQASGDIHNSGNLAITLDDSNSVGMNFSNFYSNAVTETNKPSTLTNSGNINISAGWNGIVLGSGDTIINEAGAYLSVKNASTSASAISMSSSTMINKGTINLESPNSKEEIISGDGYLLNEKDGGINILSSGGLKVSTFINRGHITVLGDDEGYTSASTLVNSGNMQMKNGSISSSSFNNTEGAVIAAKALTTYDDGDEDINSGRITIEELTCRGSFLNDSNGSITTAKALFLADSPFVNKGTLTVEDSIGFYTAGNGHYGSIVNEAGGRIFINPSSSENVGHMTLGSSGSFTNKGEFHIISKSTSGTTALKGGQGLSGEIVNEIGGVMTITASGGRDSTRADTEGITSVNKLSNYGSINVDSKALSRTSYGVGVGHITNHDGADIISSATARGLAYGMTLTGKERSYNYGNIDLTASSELQTAYGLWIVGTGLVNCSNATITSSANGVDSVALFLNSAFLYNAGTLKLDGGVELASASSRLNLLHGSTLGTVSSGQTIAIKDDSNVSASGTLYLGGKVGDNDISVSVVEGGSQIVVDSHLELSGISLSLSDDVRLRMNGDLTIATNVAVNRNGNTLTVDNGIGAHRVTLGDTVTAEWDGAVAVEEDSQALKLSSEGGNSMADGTLAAGSITVESAEGTTMTLQDMTLTVSGSEINLVNVKVQGNCSFASTSGALTLNAEGVTFVLDESNSTGVGLEPVALFSADSLTQTKVSPSVFYINSSMLEGVNVAGNMTLDLSYWSEEIKTGGYDSIALTFAENMAFGEETQVKATLDGSNFAVADCTEDNVVQFSVANLPTEVVPEPGTATLSLLALTAFAARRRRKAA